MSIFKCFSSKTKPDDRKMGNDIKPIAQDRNQDSRL